MMSVDDFNNKHIVFAFTNEGDKISFSNDNLIVTDGNGKVRLQHTCYRIFALFIVGSTTLTTGIIQRSHRFGFPIILMTPSLRHYDTIGHRTEGNFILRQRQYSYDGLEIAKGIVKNKIQSQKDILDMQIGKDNELRSAMEQLGRYVEKVDDYYGDLRGLMGIEGNAARIYFRQNFNNRENFHRMPRIKTDFVNSTLDIGYTMLFNLVDSMLNLYGFDTYRGVYHRQFYMRKSLVCDLMEPFRPLIDWQVRKSVNLGQCKEEHFNCVNGKYLLDISHNKDYISFLMKPLLRNKESIFRYFQSYYRSFMKGDDYSDYPFFRVNE